MAGPATPIHVQAEDVDGVSVTVVVLICALATVFDKQCPRSSTAGFAGVGYLTFGLINP